MSDDDVRRVFREGEERRLLSAVRSSVERYGHATVKAVAMSLGIRSPDGVRSVEQRLQDLRRRQRLDSDSQGRWILTSVGEAWLEEPW